MSAKHRTAVLCLYCDTHARSQKNFENFAANGLVDNVDFFVAGSRINYLKLNTDALNSKNFILTMVNMIIKSFQVLP